MSANDDYRTGRRGNDTVRAGSQRVNNVSRDDTPASQPNRRGGKQQGQQSVTKPSPQQQPPPTQPSQQQRATPPPLQASPSRPQNGTAQQPEHYDPLPGFNVAEVQKLLNSGVPTNGPTYRSEVSAGPARAGNPWGSKPGVMANNKDFWLELRRQVTALQRQQQQQQQATNPPARGG